MKLFVDSKEFDFIYVDVGNIITLYQMHYGDRCNKTTVSQLENSVESDTISISTSEKTIKINNIPLTYTHSYIYGMLLRTAKGRCSNAVEVKTSADFDKVYNEQLNNIIKNCSSTLNSLKETPRLSPRVRATHINSYRNMCKAFNNLTRLGGSFTNCNIANFQLLCDCYDVVMQFKGVLYPNSNIKKEV